MKKKSLYLIGFILISILGFMPFWLERKVLIWRIDAVGQYYPAFLYIGQWLRGCIVNIFQGDFWFPLFDLTIGMGEDVIGCLNYYGFGDPLNLLAVFANKENGAYIYTFMYFLRLFLAGCAFRYYCKSINIKESIIYIGALAYVFSGYAVCGGGRYIEFLSPMIYFPLMIAGCEQIIKGKRAYTLIFATMYAAMCNFYFLYMTSLFLAFYCLIRISFINGLKNFRQCVRDILQCIGFYMIGLLLAAPIFVPAVIAFFDSPRSGLNPIEILLNIENWIPNIDKFTHFFQCIYSDNGIIYWSGVPIVELILIFASIGFHKTKRDIQCILAVFMGIVAWILPIIDFIASGFGSNYTRWVFMLQFVMCTVMLVTLQNIIELLKQKQFTKYINIITSMIGAFVVLNLSFSVFQVGDSKGCGWSDAFVDSSMINGYIISPASESQSIINDETIFRISNDQLYDINNRPENTAMLNGYNGLTFWFSIINKNTQMMINQLGTPYTDKYRSYGLNHSAIYESLAGVRYFMQTKENTPVPIGYTLIESIQLNGENWRIWKNENALPIMYVYENTVSREQYDTLNYIEKMDMLLDYAVIEDGDYQPVKNRLEQTDIIVDEKEDCIILNYFVKATSEAFLYFTGGEIADAVEKVEVEGEPPYTVYAYRNYMFGLGKNDKNENVQIKVYLKEDKKIKSEELKKVFQIYSLDEDLFVTEISKLKTDKVDNITMSGNTISCLVKADKGNYLLIAVPYNRNWKAYVDGKRSELCLANTMYMAVRVPAGNHSIVLKYENAGLKYGIAMFFVGITILLMMKLLRNRHEQI